MDETEPMDETGAVDEIHRVRLALQRCQTRHAPDSRVAVFDVTTERSADGVSLRGSVSTPRLEEKARETVERATGRAVTSDLTVLEDLRTEKTVTSSVAPVRDGVDAGAEQVTQALYGAQVTVFDRDGDWSRVLTPDGYLGWIRRNVLAAMAREDANAVVVEDTTTANGDDVYTGTVCRIERSDEGEEGTVVFRTGEHATLDGTVQRPPGNPTGEEIVEIARGFLGTEYQWGGMTTDGIDCSGLAWIAYRVNGIVLPRDADQQRAMGESVERDELLPGDLLFFPGHVAISLGGEKYIHAHGSAESVVVNSFDADCGSYLAELDEKFELARRVV